MVTPLTEIKCILEERISSKSNRPYKVLVVHLAPNVDKFVFLTAAEIALLELNS